MKYIYAFILLFSFSSIFSQQITIKGTIIDKETNSSLSYANIGIYNTNIGTISDKNGNFELEIDSNLNKNTKIIFSYVGYDKLELSISTLQLQNNRIELVKSKNELKEVVISFIKPKQRKIGRTSKGLGLMHANFYTYYEKYVNDRLSKEMGMKLKIKKDCKIEDLNFNITSNDYNLIKFRLNFYLIKNNLPSELIFDKDIIFSVTNGFLGWYKLDLKSYDIFIDKENESIAVTIQWLESEKKNKDSKYFSISTAIAPSETFFYREKGFDKWKESGSSLSFYLNSRCN